MRDPWNQDDSPAEDAAQHPARTQASEPEAAQGPDRTAQDAAQNPARTQASDPEAAQGPARTAQDAAQHPARATSGPVAAPAVESPGVQQEAQRPVSQNTQAGPPAPEGQHPEPHHPNRGNETSETSDQPQQHGENEAGGQPQQRETETGGPSQQQRENETGGQPQQHGETETSVPLQQNRRNETSGQPRPGPENEAGVPLQQDRRNETSGQPHPNPENEAGGQPQQQRENETGVQSQQDRRNETSGQPRPDRENETGDHLQRDMLTPGSPFATATAADLLEGQGDTQAASEIREALAQREAAQMAEQREARLAALRPLLAELLAACPGALAAALLTPGAEAPLLLLVQEEGCGEAQQHRVRKLGAAFARIAGGALGELEAEGAGAPLELALRAQHVDAALRRVDAEHGLLLLLERGDHLGRARYLLGRFAPRLSALLSASTPG